MRKDTGKGKATIKSAGYQPEMNRSGPVQGDANACPRTVLSHKGMTGAGEEGEQPLPAARHQETLKSLRAVSTHLRVRCGR